MIYDGKTHRFADSAEYSFLKGICSDNPSVARTYVQTVSTILPSLGHLRVMLGHEDWRSIMDACCGLLEGGGWDVELLTSVIWSAAVYGRLDDPSTLRFIQGSRRVVEGSRDALVAAGKHKDLITALKQVRGRWFTCCLSVWLTLLSPLLFQVLYIIEPGSAAQGDVRALLEMLPVSDKLHEPPSISRTQR
jgi:hypothetical protein